MLNGSEWHRRGLQFPWPLRKALDNDMKDNNGLGRFDVSEEEDDEEEEESTCYISRVGFKKNNLNHKSTL